MVLIVVGISLGMEYMSIVARTRTSTALSMLALSALVNIFWLGRIQFHAVEFFGRSAVKFE